MRVNVPMVVFVVRDYSWFAIVFSVPKSMLLLGFVREPVELLVLFCVRLQNFGYDSFG